VKRRAFLTGGLAAGAAVVCAADAPPSRDTTVSTLRIAGGEPAGSYLPFVRLLVRELEVAAPGLRCTAIATEGSVENLRLVATGRADVGLSLADMPELSGRIVSVGAAGSGGAVLGARLLEGVGLRGVRVLRLPMPAARTAMLGGTIDAMLVSGGVPITVLAELDAAIGIRLLPLGEYRSLLGPPGQTVYESVPVPPGAYHGGSDVDTVGVANLLVCAPALPFPLAAAVTGVLAERAGALIPAQAVGTQFLDVRSLINTGTVPLHPGAVHAYRERHG
jgi:TRAP-type uncharacterized transport system substrate-binding protein